MYLHWTLLLLLTVGMVTTLPPLPLDDTIVTVRRTGTALRLEGAGGGNGTQALHPGSPRGTFDKIYGGEEVDLMEYPWFVAFARRDGRFRDFICGAGLVASRWVVSAAHCTRGRRASSMSLVLGLHDWDRVGSPANRHRRVVRVRRIITHPRFNSSVVHGADLVLLELAEKVDLELYTPVCLPPPGAEDYTGKWASLPGFGQTEHGSNSNQLLDVQLPIVTMSACRKAGRILSSVPGDGFICAGGAYHESACNGDSGGPLTVELGGRHLLVGIVSYGASPCAQEGQYAVFTRVSHFTTWIRATIKANGGDGLCG